MTHTGGHLTHIISESVKASIQALKLHHDSLKRHTTHGRRRRSGGGWSGMGQRTRRLSLWPLRSKLGLAPSNGPRADVTHNGEVRKLGTRDRGVVNDPRDRKRKDKLYHGSLYPYNYKGVYEVKRKVNSKVLDEGQQKASTRLSNRIIVRQGM